MVNWWQNLVEILTFFGWKIYEDKEVVDGKNTHFSCMTGKFVPSCYETAKVLQQLLCAAVCEEASLKSEVMS